MKKIVLWAAAGAALVALVGCETVQGVGRDITNAGSSTQRLLSGDRGGRDGGGR